MPEKVNKTIYIILLLLVSSGCNETSRTIEEEAQKIHQKVLTVDTHTDTPWQLIRGNFDLSEKHDYSKYRSQVDLPRMKEGGLDAIFFASFVGQRERNEEGNAKAFQKCMQQIDSIHSHIKVRNDLAEIALTPTDAYRIEKAGKRAIFIGIENGYPIGNDIQNIETFFDKGACYITLCHTRNNDICDSSNDTTAINGLSSFGEEVIKEMNRLGMMIDVSHISDSSFYHVIELTKVPIIASHSCSRAICDNPRNLNDDMLKKLAKNGGVIQMCILSEYVKETPPNPQRDSAQNVIRTKYRGFDDLEVGNSELKF